MRAFYVYIPASTKGRTLYLGVTDDIARRIFEHREGRGSIFAHHRHARTPREGWLPVPRQAAWYPDSRDCRTDGVAWA
jgi:hypothetical protein